MEVAVDFPIVNTGCKIIVCKRNIDYRSAANTTSKVGLLPTLTHCKLFMMRKSSTNSPQRFILGQFQQVE